MRKLNDFITKRKRRLQSIPRLGFNSLRLTKINRKEKLGFLGDSFRREIRVSRDHERVEKKISLGQKTISFYERKNSLGPNLHENKL